MSFHVTLAARARRDIDELFDWLAGRSLEGARRWYSQLLAQLEALADTARWLSTRPRSR